MSVTSNIIKIRLNLSNLNQGHYNDYTLNFSHLDDESVKDILAKLCAFSLYGHNNIIVTKQNVNEERPIFSLENFDQRYDISIETRRVGEKYLKSFIQKSNNFSYVSVKNDENIAYVNKHKAILSRGEVVLLDMDDFDPDDNLFLRSVDATVTIDGSDIFVTVDESNFNIKLFVQ